MSSLKLYNTLTKRKQSFKPIKDKEVKIYSCGPTVYNRVHIGNLRAFVFYDLLRAYLKYRDFKVTQAMNITDVDDKTIAGSQQQKIPLETYTRYYTELFFQDLAKLNIDKFEFYPKATDHVQEMIDLIQILIEKGYAYKTPDGIYFSISKFKDYGKLSKLDMKSLKTGASGRVSKDEYEKESPQDFALWKFYIQADGDVYWQAPFGKGRPGWHIECSAMSKKYLGQPFDIHMGGIDLIFPHHENEIAQSEAAYGKKFANFWAHNEHLLVDGKKMSKSLGNFYTLKDLEDKGHEDMVVRYFFIASNYRQKVNFTQEGLLAAKEAYKKIKDFILDNKDNEDHLEMNELVRKSREEFIEAMNDDLNTPQALSVLFNFMRNANKLGAGKKATEFILEINKVFRIFPTHQVQEQIPQEVLQLAEQRKIAKQQKNWVVADNMRNEITKRGYEVRDTPEGYILRKL